MTLLKYLKTTCSATLPNPPNKGAFGCFGVLRYIQLGESF
jgi:hypothetical protein